MTIATGSRSMRPADATISRVGWTRGLGCKTLADLLAGDDAVHLEGDLPRACVNHRIDLMVARRLTSFDLVAVAVPHSLDLDRVTAVAAAVGGGPHSDLAASVAHGVADRLRVRGELATVYRSADDREEAAARLERMGASFPELEHRLVEAPGAEGVAETLSPTTLLVLGAPGGSWLQRQVFGPGHRLRVAAPCGSIVVRSAPRRCFHEIEDARPLTVSPHLAIEEARRLVRHATAPVADGGELVGILRKPNLHSGPSGATVADVMEPPVYVAAQEPLEAIEDLAAFLDGGPIPVVDGIQRLIGTIQHDVR